MGFYWANQPGENQEDYFKPNIMYRNTEDFAKDWNSEVQSTIKLFKAIPEDKADITLDAPGLRSLRSIAWHLVGTMDALASQLKWGPYLGENWHEMKPGSMEEVIAAYETSSKAYLEDIEKHWTNTDLGFIETMWGHEISRGLVLSEFTIGHQCHHRGQMTIIMRLCGIKVPGLYGPSYDEWKDMGRDPMA